MIEFVSSVIVAFAWIIPFAVLLCPRLLVKTIWFMIKLAFKLILFAFSNFFIVILSLFIYIPVFNWSNLLGIALLLFTGLPILKWNWKWILFKCDMYERKRNYRTFEGRRQFFNDYYDRNY